MMSPTPPAVSVIVPAYGLAHVIGETIRSILAQTFPHWEAVIVDDGAPDDVEGAVRPYLGDPRISLLKTDNKGLSAARNRAIAGSGSDLIALLDGDDLYEPTYLARMMAPMRSDPTLGFVTCDATYFGASRVGRRFSQFVPQVEPITLERVLRREFNAFVASIFRRTAFDAAGGFDVALRSAEDLDLWIKILEQGWAARYIGAPLVHYRRRPESMSSNRHRLLGETINVYAQAETRLRGQPAGQVAAAMRGAVARELALAEGEALVLGGHPREGLRRLHESEPWRRGLKWQLAWPFLAIPGLAHPLLAARARFNRKF